MGNFYVNTTVSGPSQEAVSRALSGRRAYVSPALNNYVVIYDQASGEDPFEGFGLTERISQVLKCPALIVGVFDDDVLLYRLYVNGALMDEYNSDPGYGESSEITLPTGGDGAKLHSAFSTGDATRLSSILRRARGSEQDQYLFESERHADLAKELGMPVGAVALGFSYVEQGEGPPDFRQGLKKTF